MTRRRSGSSPVSIILFLLVMTCIFLIGYGTYVYVQDRTDSPTPIPKPANTGFILDSEQNDDMESDGNELDSEDDFKELDANNDIKSGLAQGTEQEAPGGTSLPRNNESSVINIEVSFSTYDQSQKTFSAGFILINDNGAQVNSCSLRIQASSGLVVSQKANTAGQHSVSGCRFNNISLQSLSEPSGLSPWKLAVHGNDANGRSLVTLEKDITSTAKLDNLINFNPEP